MIDPAILQRAREKAAAELDAVMIDSLGREHPSVLPRGIMSGQCDGGTIVTKHIPAAEAEMLKARPETEE